MGSVTHGVHVAGAGKSLVAGTIMDELPAYWAKASACLGPQSSSAGLQQALERHMEKRTKVQQRACDGMSSCACFL